MTTPEQLKPIHDQLQERLLPNQMAIREGIVIDVGEGKMDDYPRFGFDFFCWRSPEMTKEMDAFIKYAKGKRLLFDIGAYHGIFSLVFSRLNPDSECFAFEPFLEPFVVLEKVCRNDKNILCINTALSDKEEEIRMREWGGHLEVHEEGNIIVKCKKGDDYFDQDTIPDFIKCDVEGHELKVLNGLRQTIQIARPTILLELHYNKLTKFEVDAIVSIIDENSYSVIDVMTDEVIPSSDLLNQTGEKRIILK